MDDVKKVIAVDFDGVLFRPREPDGDRLIVVGDARENGMSFLRRLAKAENVSVVIIGDRALNEYGAFNIAGVNAMFKAMERAAEALWPGEEQPWLRSLDFSSAVPGNAVAILSARAVPFKGTFSMELLDDVLDGPEALTWPELPQADPFSLGPVGDNGSERSPVMGTLRMGGDPERAAGAPDQPNAGAPPVEQMRASDGSGGTGGTGVVTDPTRPDPFALDEVEARKDAKDGTANLSQSFAASEGDAERAAGATNGPTPAAAPVQPPADPKAPGRRAGRPRKDVTPAPVPTPPKDTPKPARKKAPAKKAPAKKPGRKPAKKAATRAKR